MNTKLATFAEILFQKHPTRMFKREKGKFLEYCKTEFENLGYEVIIKADQNLLGLTSSNLVAGKPDADILFTAHYDTPARNGVLLSFNRIFGMLIGGVVFLIPLILLLSLTNRFAYELATVAWWPDLLPFNLRQIIDFLINVWLISLFIVKNPRNRNDNTSGVIGVYKMAQLIAENPELKNRCAFILFDHEEILPGLLGSRAFAKWRKKNHPDKVDGVVINFDCIGVGELLTVMTKKEHDGWHKIAEHMQSEGFNAKKIKSGLGLAGNSDHSPFPKGVSLLFQRRSLFKALYIPNIHSGKDKVCDIVQIEQLGDALYNYVR